MNLKTYLEVDLENTKPDLYGNNFNMNNIGYYENLCVNSYECFERCYESIARHENECINGDKQNCEPDVKNNVNNVLNDSCSTNCISTKDLLSKNLDNESEINFEELWSSYKTEDVIGDGHCLISALSKSLKSQHNIMISNDEILREVDNESRTHQNKYLPLFENNSETIFRYEMNEYIVNKRWDSSVGDLIPVMLRDALALSIVIIFKDGMNYYCHKLPFYKESTESHTVYIYKQGNHYLAVVKHVKTEENYILDNTLVYECDNTNVTKASSKLPRHDSHSEKPACVESGVDLNVKICFWTRGVWSQQVG